MEPSEVDRGVHAGTEQDAQVEAGDQNNPAGTTIMFETVLLYHWWSVFIKKNFSTAVFECLER